PHGILNFLDELFVARALGHDKGLHHLATQGIGHANGGRFEHGRMLEDGVFDLDGAYGPARGNDDVIGTAGVVEVAVFVGAAEILGGDPFAATQYLHLADFTRFAGPAFGVLHLDDAAGNRLAE